MLQVYGYEKIHQWRYIFSGRIVCGECGAYYGSKVWHSTDSYRCTIWRCNRKYDKADSYCKTPHIREEEIKAAFEKALELMLERRQEIVAAYERIITELTVTSKQDIEAERIQDEIEVYNAELERMVRRNAENVQDQDAYKKAFDEVSGKCDILSARLNKINEQLLETAGRKRKLEAFINNLKAIKGLTGFDEHLFSGTVERVIINRGESKNEKRVSFYFKDGTEIEV